MSYPKFHDDMPGYPFASEIPESHLLHIKDLIKKFTHEDVEVCVGGNDWGKIFIGGEHGSEPLVEMEAFWTDSVTKRGVYKQNGLFYGFSSSEEDGYEVIHCEPEVSYYVHVLTPKGARIDDHEYPLDYYWVIYEGCLPLNEAALVAVGAWFIRREYPRAMPKRLYREFEKLIM